MPYLLEPYALAFAVFGVLEVALVLFAVWLRARGRRRPPTWPTPISPPLSHVTRIRDDEAAS